MEISEKLNPVQYVRQKYFNTQSEFAAWLSRKTGRRVDQTTVSRWENWEQTPNNDVRRVLSDYVNMDEQKIYLMFKREIERRKAYDN